ncbi:hypothetical protein DACRYDRAFT_115464 [Dacryopinax primogenitus]|uniref:BTB domain-containing protein n=1 Tax=Dacryopinax primogenitus (strain DJM 731) TaxID=1858805 RepID=M5G4W1_DACPD|nr:uncharacterized protein DACRYDRAFT_115464 [Dacryopinax primogenitus]EJU03260.1 hypothetical protein DACRYDRAFT_115464 [Dacryopinax primogenitus]
MALYSYPTPLHVLYSQKDTRGFRQLLDARQQSNGPHSGAGGSSLPRSWGVSSLGPVGNEVNARDGFGRTLLHIAAASLDGWAPEWVRICLAQKGIDVNLQDPENAWSALHRALYVGNLHAVRLLMERADTDLKSKDHEDFTPWDVYNLTVDGTYPDFEAPYGTMLYTWGVNRNFTLGLGDGDDRTYPEPINLARLTPPSNATGSARFDTIGVSSIVMAKLHTGIVTSEARANVRLCGFGSGGRLGAGSHTQYSFAPLKDFAHTVTALALGQDHTLALTSSGEVYSWGLGRFAQLGYIIDKDDKGAADSEQVQYSPKKVVGSLKGKEVRGIAACKTASAAWTREGLYTWGTNAGQLGYDRHTVPTQVSPRKVTAVTQGVIDAALAENAMCVLLESQDVLCFWNGIHFKINFPAQKFKSESSVYRPPQAIVKVMINKLVVCENAFVALSTFGDVFFFTLPDPGNVDNDSEKFTLKPQRIWATRCAESMAKDVGVGADGTVLLCTATGHVFSRQRNQKLANDSRRSLPGQGAPPGPGNLKSFKFHRVPWLQRVIKVSANSTGAFGAIAVDAVPKRLDLTGPTLGEQLVQGLPHFKQVAGSRATSDSDVQSPMSLSSDNISPVPVTDEDDDDGPSETFELMAASQVVEAYLQLEEDKLAQVTKVEPMPARHLWGADVSIEVAGCTIYAHQAILAARSTVLKDALAGKGYTGSEVAIALSKNAKGPLTKLNIRLLTRPSTVMQELQDLPLVFHPLSVLLLLQYLYSDTIPSIWDRLVGERLLGRYPKLKLHASRLRAEVSTLARALGLSALEAFMSAATYARRTPTPTLIRDMSRLFASSQGREAKYDMVLQLKDRQVHCHSAVLRTRSPFFASMFDDEDWMADRWSNEHVVQIDMRHLTWEVMEPVCAYIYEDKGLELLDNIVRNTVDDYIDYVCHVMAVASELLLDKLMLVCSSVILRHVNLYNIPSLLADAAHLSAKPLLNSLCGYLAMNLESVMESRLLDDMPRDLLGKVGEYIRSLQAERSPVARSGILIEEAMKTNMDWSSMEDFPQPIQRSWKKMVKPSPKLSPINPLSPRISPLIKPLMSPPANKNTHFKSPPLVIPDDGGIFAMDEDVETSRIPPMSLDTPASSQPASPLPIPNRAPVWKGKSLQAHQKADMRSIMAEEATSNGRYLPTGVGSAPKGQGFPAYAPLLPAKGLGVSPSPSRTPSGVSVSSTTGPSTSTPSTPQLRLAGRPLTQRSPSGAQPPATSGSHLPTPTMGTRQPAFKGPALGPIITPVRATPSDSTSRRRNQDAWTSGGPLLSTSPPSAGPSSGNLSFLAIQQEQKEALLAGTKAPKKPSLLEIQEQERTKKLEEQASREETAFIQWWAQEEERMRRGAGRGIPLTEGPDGGRSQRRGKGRGKGETTEGGRGGHGGRGGRRGGAAREKGKCQSQATVGA